MENINVNELLIPAARQAAQLLLDTSLLEKTYVAEKLKTSGIRIAKRAIILNCYTTKSDDNIKR
jgi:hypothetical protein